MQITVILATFGLIGALSTAALLNQGHERIQNTANNRADSLTEQRRIQLNSERSVSGSDVPASMPSGYRTLSDEEMGDAVLLNFGMVKSWDWDLNLEACPPAPHAGRDECLGRNRDRIADHRSGQSYWTGYGDWRRCPTDPAQRRECAQMSRWAYEQVKDLAWDAGAYSKWTELKKTESICVHHRDPEDDRDGCAMLSPETTEAEAIVRLDDYLEKHDMPRLTKRQKALLKDDPDVLAHRERLEAADIAFHYNDIRPEEES